MLAAALVAGTGAAQPSDDDGAAHMKRDACPDAGEQPDAWLDRTQSTVYETICGSAMWFDRLFSGDDAPAGTELTYGRLSVGAFLDERDGFDPALRLRARIPLPAFESKLRVLVGRGGERDVVEQQEQWTGVRLPEAFRDVEDPVWLLGLGYGKDTELEQGWELDTGVRIRVHPDLIARAIYRKDRSVREDTIGRFRQTFFWRARRGVGFTTQVSLDRLLGNEFMVRWANSGTVVDDFAGMEWISALSLYQDLPHKRWLSYTALIRGQTAAAVRMQDFGVEVRYRRPVLREWLFLELSGSGTFPRYDEFERRSFNPGVGLRFEMFFGPAPREYVR